jgi:hypothetical protein
MRRSPKIRHIFAPPWPRESALVVTAQRMQIAAFLDEQGMRDVRAAAIFAKSASKCITSVDNGVTAA